MSFMSNSSFARAFFFGTGFPVWGAASAGVAAREPALVRFAGFFHRWSPESTLC